MKWIKIQTHKSQTKNSKFNNNQYTKIKSWKWKIIKNSIHLKVTTQPIPSLFQTPLDTYSQTVSQSTIMKNFKIWKLTLISFRTQSLSLLILTVIIFKISLSSSYNQLLRLNVQIKSDWLNRIMIIKKVLMSKVKKIIFWHDRFVWGMLNTQQLLMN